MPIFSATSLGQTITSLYKERKLTVNFMIEGVGSSFIYVPICFISLVNGVEARAYPEMIIRDSIKDEPDYTELMDKRADITQNKDKKAGDSLKQIEVFAGLAASSSERWLRDCLLAAGILEPTYSLLGYRGHSRAGQVNFAEHLEPLSYVFVFDTNVFMKNIFSNYLRLRSPDMSRTVTSVVPAVIWELERMANNKSKPQESRLGQGAFRDIALMQSTTRYVIPRVEPTEAEPTDRLIRQQIRKFPFELLIQDKMKLIEHKVFVTFDRTNALAAHAEGMFCCSLDVPLEQPSWQLKPVGNQTVDEMVGCVFMQLAILGGTTKITCDGVKDTYVMGDWAGKTSDDWLHGNVRLDNFPTA